MGYLDNTEITVDAILTKKGRAKLAKGESLGITKFAVGDDEIDYTLYEPAHPKGSAYYDAAIRAIPVTEASSDETQVMRYKLVTLPEGTTSMSRISFGFTAINVNSPKSGTTVDASVTLSPTGEGSVDNSMSGYTLMLANTAAGTIQATGTLPGATPTYIGDISNTAQVVTGLSFKFVPKSDLTTKITTTITAYGNDTGGTQTITVTVNPVTV